MGLTNSSVSLNAKNECDFIKKRNPNDKIIVLAGNPNVGKSTVFNALTGLNQHTGNWPGKTVGGAQGYFEGKNGRYVIIDVPGAYSLKAHSAEEETARKIICFEKTDAVIVVCDATCIERNLNLVLQITEMQKNVIVCVNLMDEARRKKIQINLNALSKMLGTPVVGISARNKKTLAPLINAVENKNNLNPILVKYDDITERAIEIVKKEIDEKIGFLKINRWIALRLLENDKNIEDEISKYVSYDILSDNEITSALEKANALLEKSSINSDKLKDLIVTTIFSRAEKIAKKSVTYQNEKYSEFDRKADKIFTNRITGIPIMLLLVALVFYITISGANYPSQILSKLLFSLQEPLMRLCEKLHIGTSISNLLIFGAYRTTAWIVSVMLPPMAIFFPLFTLLEDSGYLPRIAYNLDKSFKKCNACGKQALTMCMGFGCNAAGVVGCRIIDSPRERLLAVLTNSFVPCNGRFPTLISLITMFFVGANANAISGIKSSFFLTLAILLGIIFTFITTYILSKTVLKGIPSSFTLEMPPYRMPKVGSVIVRSIFDRTLFVLARAAVTAVPAGIIIYLSANVNIGGQSILKIVSAFLDPFAHFMGLDGVILLAFILGFPANEIVIPIIIMAYTAEGTLSNIDNLFQLKELFISNGWNSVTAICTMLFSMFHWPCSTTLITVKKETKSLKWTIAAFLIPTLTGIIVCFAVSSICKLFI